MRKYRTLKFICRCFTTRKFRCNKRKVFFEKLFASLKGVKDRFGNPVLGSVQNDQSGFERACQEMATFVSFYPFESRSYIEVGKFFAKQSDQPFYTHLKVRIIRTSSLWDFIWGFGDYDVLVFDSLDDNRKQVDAEYKAKKVPIF